MAEKKTTGKEIATAAETTPEAKAALTASQRFTQMITREFSEAAGPVNITPHQRNLIQGYFVRINSTLAKAEEERLAKNARNGDHKFDNPVPYTWDHCNLEALKFDLVQAARIGYDMREANHLFPIPYFNKRTGKYDIALMPGYNGIIYEANKYAIDRPVSVTAELVYKTDEFRPLKKDADHPVETYEFEIRQPFDRGEIVGGFAYIEFKERAKNKLVIFTLADILKRKPATASAEFWGGKGTVWENGKKVERELEGWTPEMYIKTILRAAHGAKYIPRDPRKVASAEYDYMKEREADFAAIAAQAEIRDNTASVEVDFDEVNEPDQMGPGGADEPEPETDAAEGPEDDGLPV